MLFRKKSKPSKESDESQSKSEPRSLAIAYNIKRKSKSKGAVRPSLEESDVSPKSIADAIMRIREEKKMADGGMVDIEENQEETDADSFDEYNEDAMEPISDDDQLDEQPEDSNTQGRDIDSDKHDMIEAIRKKMKLKKD